MGLAKDYMAELGEFVAAFSGLEMVLTLLTTFLLDTDQARCLMVVTERGARDRVELVENLFDSRLDDEPKKFGLYEKRFRLLKGRLEKANTKRNELIHSWWGFQKESEAIVITPVRSRGKQKVRSHGGFPSLSPRKLRFDELQNAVRDVRALIQDVDTFLKELPAIGE
jgi:hypothetical protein